MPVELDWLPKHAGWKDELASLKTATEDSWAHLQRLSKCRLDFVQTAKLDRQAQRLFAKGLVNAGDAVRVALLGSSTTKHLVSGVRVAGMRRGLWVEVYEGGYGQYFQELMDSRSGGLEAFRPEFVVLALDAPHLAELMRESVDGALERVAACWEKAKARFGATVVQQTGLPVLPDLFGSNEHRLPESPQSRLAEMNVQLRVRADAAGVALLAVDRYVAWGGLDAWHDPALWNLAKQEVHAAAAPLYGDLLMRLVAAQRGRSAKCMVLDLDNTLWGGVVGDDGVEGISLSQGDATGEAHLAFQRYCLEMKRRGVLLAVCSKNDDANARAAFARKEMVLREDDIACFVANWNDKATNLRSIAEQLKIGLEALVFVDDNPAERELIRRELPKVAVPELPEDPAGLVRCVSSAGYFEGLVVTEEDRSRAAIYCSNGLREELRERATDLRGYLRSLEMRLEAKPFDVANLQRIVQLANKTNQFNVTMWRFSEADVMTLMQDPCAMTWQVSLRDRFSNHGTVALLCGRMENAGTFELTQWLMSCRVLGRGVEEACLNLIVRDLEPRRMTRLRAVYRPTAKNAMVRDLFDRIGFKRVHGEGDRWELETAAFVPMQTEVAVG